MKTLTAVLLAFVSLETPTQASEPVTALQGATLSIQVASTLSCTERGCSRDAYPLKSLSSERPTDTLYTQVVGPPFMNFSTDRFSKVDTSRSYCRLDLRSKLPAKGEISNVVKGKVTSVWDGLWQEPSPDAEGAWRITVLRLDSPTVSMITCNTWIEFTTPGIVSSFLGKESQEAARVRARTMTEVSTLQRFFHSFSVDMKSVVRGLGELNGAIEGMGAKGTGAEAQSEPLRNPRPASTPSHAPASGTQATPAQ